MGVRAMPGAGRQRRGTRSPCAVGSSATLRKPYRSPRTQARQGNSQTNVRSVPSNVYAWAAQRPPNLVDRQFGVLHPVAAICPRARCALTGGPVAVELAAHSLPHQPEERNHGAQGLIWSCDFHDR